ncbi:hypothetical protein HMPREF1982_00017 [Clostridiales bacterium oral taxon 876 str. F0540]|nr:hypothetical protein HMPREF1982_00017 [Clostridiales bacterium oral taxon 876 str. F0540]
MEDIKIGSSLSFGGYNWRVLDIQNNAALIITEYMIEQQTYNNYAGDVTWADCSLRKYLNGEFYDKFTATEQSRIIPVLNKNHENQWYGTKGGADTLDYIFLLSIEEVVCKYFGDSSKNLENRSAKQRYWFQKKDKNNYKRKSTFDWHVSSGLVIVTA